MKKLAIVLSESELLELQQIIIDEDREASLEFIKQSIAPKIPAKGTAPCDSSRINPYLMSDNKQRGGEIE